MGALTVPKNVSFNVMFIVSRTTQLTQNCYCNDCDKENYKILAMYRRKGSGTIPVKWQHLEETRSTKRRPFLRKRSAMETLWKANHFQGLTPIDSVYWNECWSYLKAVESSQIQSFPERSQKVKFQLKGQERR